MKNALLILSFIFASPAFAEAPILICYPQRVMHAPANEFFEGRITLTKGTLTRQETIQLDGETDRVSAVVTKVVRVKDAEGKVEILIELQDKLPENGMLYGKALKGAYTTQIGSETVVSDRVTCEATPEFLKKL